MELAEDVQTFATCRDILNLLRSHDIESIWPILQQLEDTSIREDVTRFVFAELARIYTTPGLDKVFRKQVMDMQASLSNTRCKVLAFNRELHRIDTELTGYSKYQWTLAYLGKDPMPYAEWVELDDSSSKLLAR